MRKTNGLIIRISKRTFKHMKIIYKIIISISIFFGLLLFNSGNVNADDTITYSNSSILNIDNKHNSISVESPDSGTETIHNVPIKIRSDLQKTINNNKKDIILKFLIQTIL